MKNQETTIKSIKNYINNEFKGVEVIETMDQMSKWKYTHAMGCGYSTEYHIEEGDYSQETYNLVMNSDLVDILNDLYCDWNNAMADDMRQNPKAYDLTEDDMEWINDEDYVYDEEGFEYTKFTNYFVTLAQEAIEIIEIEERTELLESHGFDITDNSTIEIDAEYVSDNVNISITIYGDWDFSMNVTDDEGDDIDFDGHMCYESGKWIHEEFSSELLNASNRYSKEAFTTYLTKAMQSIKKNIETLPVI